MREICLDCGLMADKESAHAQIAEKLGFPDWYGGNLDALWDMLTTCDEAEILLLRPAELTANLGEYGAALAQTFEEAARENTRLRVIFEKEPEDNSGPDGCKSDSAPQNSEDTGSNDGL